MIRAVRQFPKSLGGGLGPHTPILVGLLTPPHQALLYFHGPDFGVIIFLRRKVPNFFLLRGAVWGGSPPHLWGYALPPPPTKLFHTPLPVIEMMHTSGVEGTSRHPGDGVRQERSKVAHPAPKAAENFGFLPRIH